MSKFQKKLYFQYIETNSKGELVGTHATPVKRYIDNLTFGFDGNGNACTVQVFEPATTSILHHGFTLFYFNSY